MMAKTLPHGDRWAPRPSAERLCGYPTHAAPCCHLLPRRCPTTGRRSPPTLTTLRSPGTARRSSWDCRALGLDELGLLEVMAVVDFFNWQRRFGEVLTSSSRAPHQRSRPK